MEMSIEIMIELITLIASIYQELKLKIEKSSRQALLPFSDKIQYKVEISISIFFVLIP